MGFRCLAFAGLFWVLCSVRVFVLVMEVGVGPGVVCFVGYFFSACFGA